MDNANTESCTYLPDYSSLNLSTPLNAMQIPSSTGQTIQEMDPQTNNNTQMDIITSKSIKSTGSIESLDEVENLEEIEDMEQNEQYQLFIKQLDTELQKNRPDHFIIAVVCRLLGGIPSNKRIAVWKELLGIAHCDILTLEESLTSVEKDLDNQKVILADAMRTRGKDLLFKQQKIVDLIGKLLTYYCKAHGVRYKQGMNEVLAPFLILAQDPENETQLVFPVGFIYQCFDAMVARFLPQAYVDDEFKSLQCSFALYRLALAYHDPELCLYLDRHDMTPELYTTPWFMTLFARNLPASQVFILWDFFLLQSESILLHFVALALVEAHKQEIYDAEIVLLPQVLSNITFKDKSELMEVCARALELVDQTPASFKSDLNRVCYGGYSDAILHWAKMSCLHIYPDEIVTSFMSRVSKDSESKGYIGDENLGSKDILHENRAQASSTYGEQHAGSNSSPAYILLDCRPIEDYQECHLSLSYHIDPDIFNNIEDLFNLLDGFSQMKGCHFCFLGPPEPQINLSAIQSPGKLRGFNTALLNAAFARLSGRKSDAVSREDLPPKSENQPVVPKTSSDVGLSQESQDSIPPSRPLYEENEMITQFISTFLQNGFKYVSRLDGGFEAIKSEIIATSKFAQDQLLVVAKCEDENATSSSLGLNFFAKRALDRVLSSSDNEKTNAVSVSSASSTTDATLEEPQAEVKSKPKSTVSNLSQRIQFFASAAKDVITQGKLQALSTSAPKSSTEVTESQILDECLDAQLSPDPFLSINMTEEVIFDEGPFGILFQQSRQQPYHVIIDDIVPNSQASASKRLTTGDLLISINGQSVADIPFLTVIHQVKRAPRPIIMGFQKQKSNGENSIIR